MKQQELEKSKEYKYGFVQLILKVLGLQKVLMKKLLDLYQK